MGTMSFLEDKFTLKGYLDDGTTVISCRHCFIATAAEPVIRDAWLVGIAYAYNGQIFWVNPRRIKDIELVPYAIEYYRPM